MSLTSDVSGPHALLAAYIRALAEHRWEAVEDMFVDDAVCIFSEGTFVGKTAIEEAFRRTFATIQDEHYEVRNEQWTLWRPDAAACHYEFHWRGIVEGRVAKGGGRGTSILQRFPTGWKIVHEHLGPAPS